MGILSLLCHLWHDSGSHTSSRTCSRPMACQVTYTRWPRAQWSKKSSAKTTQKTCPTKMAFKIKSILSLHSLSEGHTRFTQLSFVIMNYDFLSRCLYSLAGEVSHPHPDVDLPVRHPRVRHQGLVVHPPRPALERCLQGRIWLRGSLSFVFDAKRSSNWPVSHL